MQCSPYPICLHNPFLCCKDNVLLTCKEELLIKILIFFIMAKNQNFSNLLLKNNNNEILITFKLTTPSKKLTVTTTHPVSSKSPINDSPVDISDRFMNHLQQKILFLQTGLRNNKDDSIKS